MKKYVLIVALLVSFFVPQVLAQNQQDSYGVPDQSTTLPTYRGPEDINYPKPNSGAQDVAAPGVNCGKPVSQAKGADPLTELFGSAVNGQQGAETDISKCCYQKPVEGADSPLTAPLNGVMQSYSDYIKTSKPLSPCIYGDATVNGQVVTDPKDYATSCFCKLGPEEDYGLKKLIDKCNNYIQDATEKNQCVACVKSIGMWTGLGCVPLDLTRFINQFVFGFGIGLAGFIAMLCIIYSAVTMQLSRGNPERIKKAQEYITSCIMGLILIIFSVFILRVIGYDILRIPFL